MQPIKLPPMLVADDLARYSWSVPAKYGKYLVFAYSTVQGQSTDNNNTLADRGPLVLINLETLATEIIDELVNKDAFTSAFGESRSWAHLSEDGRYLRSLNGDLNGMDLREVDLSTGEARTIHSATTLHYTSQILGSLTGDLWAFRKDGILIDLNGDQAETDEDTQRYAPLKDGRILVFARGCDDNCEVKVLSPFNGEGELTYTVPWAASTFHNPLVNMLTEDQNLLFPGSSLDLLSSTPAIVDKYPSFPPYDRPVFRLAPGGSARLIGFYQETETAMDTIPASTDGRYLLLRSVDLSSYFVYNTKEDRSVGEFPVDPSLEYFGGSLTFFENGFITRITASTADQTYRDYYLTHSFQTGKTFSWESDLVFLDFFTDILPEGALICTAFPVDSQLSSIGGFNPETQK